MHLFRLLPTSTAPATDSPSAESAACSAHPQCGGLEGPSCCPTVDDVFLSCCRSPTASPTTADPTKSPTQSPPTAPTPTAALTASPSAAPSFAPITNPTPPRTSPSPAANLASEGGDDDTGWMLPVIIAAAVAVLLGAALLAMRRRRQRQGDKSGLNPPTVNLMFAGLSAPMGTNNAANPASTSVAQGANPANNGKRDRRPDPQPSPHPRFKSSRELTRACSPAHVRTSTWHFLLLSRTIVAGVIYGSGPLQPGDSTGSFAAAANTQHYSAVNKHPANDGTVYQSLAADGMTTMTRAMLAGNGNNTGTGSAQSPAMYAQLEQSGTFKLAFFSNLPCSTLSLTLPSLALHAAPQRCRCVL